jgi:Protein of unknown function (DUF2442)
MKTKSKPLGKNTLVEVTHISPHGLWLLIGEREYLLPFADYPWFADAKVSDLHQVELLHGHHLRWSALDVDLDLAALDDPAGYPLIYIR